MQNLPKHNQKLETSILTRLSEEERKHVINTKQTVFFGQFDNEQKQNLAKSLVKMCYFVGIKEPLSLDQLKMLVYFLCTKFPRTSIEQMEDAFLMACSGEFGEIEHFQNFSPIYVAKIINSYHTKRGAAIQKYNRLLEQEQSEKESREKAKNFDVEKALVDVLTIEYKKWKNKTDKTPNNYLEHQTEVAIRFCQKNGLFTNYSEKHHTANEYISSFFVALQKQPNIIMDEAIKNYVLSKRKNMES